MMKMACSLLLAMSAKGMKPVGSGGAPLAPQQCDASGSPRVRRRLGRWWWSRNTISDWTKVDDFMEAKLGSKWKRLTGTPTAEAETETKSPVVTVTPAIGAVFLKELEDQVKSVDDITHYCTKSLRRSTHTQPFETGERVKVDDGRFGTLLKSIQGTPRTWDVHIDGEAKSKEIPEMKLKKAWLDSQARKKLKSFCDKYALKNGSRFTSVKAVAMDFQKWITAATTCLGDKKHEVTHEQFQKDKYCTCICGKECPVGISMYKCKNCDACICHDCSGMISVQAVEREKLPNKLTSNLLIFGKATGTKSQQNWGKGNGWKRAELFEINGNLYKEPEAKKSV